MKDITIQAPKVKNAIKFILFIACVHAISAQKGDTAFIAKDEYDIINTVLGDQNQKKTLIYKKTCADKGWTVYFSPENFSLITKKAGIPTVISDTILKEYLTDGVLSEVRNAIYKLKPARLQKKQLHKSIKLVNSFDSSTALKKGVIRISKPIIINNLAVFRKIGMYEAPVFILKKENGKWNIMYTFYDWLILED